jgi:hypothetical protein
MFFNPGTNSLSTDIVDAAGIERHIVLFRANIVDVALSVSNDSLFYPFCFSLFSVTDLKLVLKDYSCQQLSVQLEGDCSSIIRLLFPEDMAGKVSFVPFPLNFR